MALRACGSIRGRGIAGKLSARDADGCEAMTTAAMVGAGLIGRSWAMVFARAGWRVRLYDSVASQLDAAREHIAERACRAAGVRTRRRCRGCLRTHRVRRGSRASARRRRLGAGECARSARREACAVSAHRSRDAEGGDRRQLDVGDTRVAIHRTSRRTRALPRRASRQSAASRAGGRAVRRAVDRCRDDCSARER